MHVRFEVSEAFRGMPVGMSIEETYAYVREQVGQIEFGDHEVDRRLIRGIHALSRTLRAAGALYIGNSLRIINGERSLASLLVAVRKFAYGNDPRIAAEGAMHAIAAARGKGWTGGVYDLPCGPGAVVTGGHSYSLPRRDSSEAPFELPFAELQAYVPVPDHPSLSHQYLLTVSFTTPSIHHWETYMPSMVRLLRSVTFLLEAPVEPAAPGIEKEVGRVLQ